MRATSAPATIHRRSLVAATLLTTVAVGVGASPAHAAKKPTTSKAVAGEVTAVVSFKRSTKAYNRYQDLRLTVSGPTGILSKSKLPKIKNSFSRPRVTLADVNDDGVVDAIVDTFSGGAHCCSSSSVALSVATGWTKPFTQFWGNYGYELKDLGGPAGPEFSSFDDRFAYAFSSYAASFPAVQIHDVRDGKLVDVTREFPDAIRADVAEKTRLYADIQKNAAVDDFQQSVAQSAGAAWIADLLLLGDLDGAKGVLAKLGTDGFLSDSGTDELDVTGKSFKTNLVKNFVDWGYLTSGAQLGL